MKKSRFIIFSILFTIFFIFLQIPVVYGDLAQFIGCVGMNYTDDCVGKTVDCAATMGANIISCVQLAICAGKIVFKCFKDNLL